jgi:hypothetical protein
MDDSQLCYIKKNPEKKKQWIQLTQVTFLFFFFLFEGVFVCWDFQQSFLVVWIVSSGGAGGGSSEEEEERWGWWS